MQDTFSPATTLVNAEAVLASTIDKVTDRVNKVGKGPLAEALGRLSEASEEARARLQAGKIYARAILTNLADEMADFAAMFEADLNGLVELEELAETLPPADVAPVQLPHQEPGIVSPPLPAEQEPEPETAPRQEEPTVTVPLSVALNTGELPQEFQDAYYGWSEKIDKGTVDMITSAANPPADAPIPAPLTPLQGDGVTEAAVEPSASGKRPRGKRGAAKGKTPTARKK